MAYNHRDSYSSPRYHDDRPNSSRREHSSRRSNVHSQHNSYYPYPVYAPYYPQTYPAGYQPNMPVTSINQSSIAAPPNVHAPISSTTHAAPVQHPHPQSFGAYAKQPAPQTPAAGGYPTILVLGLTGTGKSTLVRHLTGNSAVTVGMRLESETQNPTFYKSNTPVGSTGLYFQYMDTPGFDDTNRIGIDVLEVIVQAIQDLRRGRHYISGIIYVHRIIDDRVSGSSRRCMEVLMRLCGPENYSRIAVVASNWDKLMKSPEGAQLAKSRMAELKRKFLEPLATGHALFTQSDTNVAACLRDFFTHHCERSGFDVQLAVEKELQQQIPLPFTQAGVVVVDQLEQKIKQVQEDLATLEEMANSADPHAREEILKQIQIQRNTLGGYASRREQMAPQRSVADIANLLGWLQREAQSLNQPTLLPGDKETLLNMLCEYQVFMGVVKKTSKTLGVAEEITLSKLVEMFQYCQ